MQQFRTSEPFIHGSLAIWMAIKSNQLSTSHVVESHHQLMLSLAKLQITTIYMSQAFLSLKHGDFGVGPLAHHTNQYLNTIYIIYIYLFIYCVVMVCHGEVIVRSLTISPDGLILAAAPSWAKSLGAGPPLVSVWDQQLKLETTHRTIRLGLSWCFDGLYI